MNRAIEMNRTTEMLIFLDASDLYKSHTTVCFPSDKSSFEDEYREFVSMFPTR